MDFGNAGKQQLTISFDLRISPSTQSGKVNCDIAVNKLVVRASNHDTISTDPVSSEPASPRYVTERVAITIGPSGRCDPPHYVHPLVPWFAERQTISTRNQYGAVFQASAYSSLTIQGLRSVGKSVDRHPVTLAVEPLRIDAGEGEDMYWLYKAHCVAQSHLELSSQNPPTHKVCYGIPHNSEAPENFRIKVEVYYCRKQIPRRLRSIFPPMYRFFKDVTPRHLVMTLEAVIGKEQEDNFVFPGIDKKGCNLDLELHCLEKGNVGQGIPIEGGERCVKSRLSTTTKCA